jgi:hypothetical protein
VSRDKSLKEVAEIIARFLEGKSTYPQEWNDFIEISLADKIVDAYRIRCYELDPIVNRPGQRDAKAIAELKSMVETLRAK